MLAQATRSPDVLESRRDDIHAAQDATATGDDHAFSPFVKHVYSAILTPKHRDVTNDRVAYASPKNFVFLSKHQMKWIDANRWCRQGTRDTTIVPVEHLTSDAFSIDNRNVDALTTPSESDA